MPLPVRDSRRLTKQSRTELLLEPLTRARDLMRVLHDALSDISPSSLRMVDAALKACESLARSAGDVQTDSGRRAFTRDLYRKWATMLEVRELLIDEALLRVFFEIEEAIESVRRLLRRFEELARSSI